MFDLINNANTVYNVYNRLTVMNKLNAFEMADFMSLSKGFPVPFKHQPNFIKNHCLRIFNEIENNYYSYDMFILYALNEFSIGKRLSYYVGFRDIDRVMATYTNKGIKKDQYIIIEINKTLNLKGIEYFFQDRQGTPPVIYDLIKERHISVYFFVKYLPEVLTLLPKNALLYKTDEQKRFEQICSLIKVLLGSTDIINHNNHKVW